MHPTYCQDEKTRMVAGDYEVAIVVAMPTIEPHFNERAIRLEFEVLGGKHDGKRIYWEFRVYCPNSDLRNDQIRELKQICAAAGISRPTLKSLIGKRLLMRVVQYDWGASPESFRAIGH